jgi:diguanylate cyclase (GGDEF)-like protein/PAS domain S-box-containing protein
LGRQHGPTVDRRQPNQTTDSDPATDPASLDGVVIEQAPIAIVGLSLEGVVCSWNRAAEALLGWPADDVVGRPPPFTLRALVHSLTGDGRLLAGMLVQGIEAAVVRRDGRSIHLHASATVCRPPDSAPQVMLFAVDVTDGRRAIEAAIEAEQRWRTLLESTSETLTLCDAEGRIHQTTGEFSDVLGYPGEWWVDRLTFDLIHPDDQPRARAAFARMLERPGAQVSDVLRTRHREGHWELIEYTAVNRLDDPMVGAAIITSRSVSDVRRAERLLADEALVLELIARGAPLDDTLAAVVEMVEYHTGSTVEIVRRVPEVSETAFLHDQLTLSGWAVLIADTTSREVLGAIQVRQRNEATPSTRQRDIADIGSHLAAIAIERDRAQRELEHQARYDQLTGLPNRWAIVEHLDDALDARFRDRREVAVLVIDVDRFKWVNDSLGHALGDKLLVAFGARLRALAPPKVFVGHFGSDEFVVVLSDISGLGEVLTTAEQLARVLGEPFRVVDDATVIDHELFLSASIGIAVAGDEANPTDLLQQADAAMYRAKARGRDRLEIFDEGMKASAAAQLRVDRELRQAVERAELALHYQPKIELNHGGIVGVEALLRWDHPERGIVQPADFISIAEETGLIVRIGTWVIEQAVRQGREWLDRLPGRDRLTLAVNLSARQLTSPGLVTAVSRVLDHYHWPPDDLVLELTESVLVDDNETTLAVLRQLKTLGVKLAIDDFGTGYSSLSYLHRFPVDIVKVDRAFVGSLQADGEGSAVASAVVHMARALGLLTAAEGVEEGNQLAGLRTLGCDWAQGFLFAEALPADDLAELLTTTPSW